MTSNSSSHYRAAGHLVFLFSDGIGCVQGPIAELNKREDFRAFLLAAERNEKASIENSQVFSSPLSPVRKPAPLKMQIEQKNAQSDAEACLDQRSAVASVMTLLKATGIQIICSILIWAALIWSTDFARVLARLV